MSAVRKISIDTPILITKIKRMLKSTVAILFFLMLFTSCNKKHERNRSYNHDSRAIFAELEKVDEIYLKENKDFLIGGVKLFKVNLGENKILITDPIFNEIKVFKYNGNFEKVIGKKGEGPGEFKRIMGVTEDNFYIYTSDDILRRISKFSKEGNFISSFPLPSSIDLNPGEIIISRNKIYISSWQMKYRSPEETYKVKPITVLDSLGNILLDFGNYDEMYKKLRINWNSPRFDIDNDENIYLTNYVSYKVFKYDIRGNLKIKFGDKGKYFMELKEGMRGNESRDELRQISLKTSTVKQIKVSDYVYLQYTNNTEEFFKTKSKFDQNHYLMVYTKDGQYIKSDIKLPGGGMLDVDENGIIYIELSDEPGNRIIGKYKIKIVDNSTR